MRRGQRARDGDDAEDVGGVAPDLRLALVAEQQREAESLVEDAREGMRGVDGDRREQRVDLLVEELRGEVRGRLRVSCFQRRMRMPAWLERGDEAVVPAGGLIVGEAGAGGRGGGRGAARWVRPPSSGCWGRPTPSSMRCRTPATRISTNSSRLLAVMARNLTRSSRGLVVSSASSRTRRLKRSQLSSRLMKRPSGRWLGGGAFAERAGGGLGRCGLFPDSHSVLRD